MIDIQDIRFIDMIPPNLRGDQNVQAAAEALDQQLREVTTLIPGVAFFHQIDTLPSEWVDQLAYQWHVDFYDPDLPLNQRRELVKNSLAWHRRKGTPSAVEELMTTIFGDGIVEEWYEYGGEPGYFRVITSNFSATTEHALRFLRAVNSVKNARSWLDTVIIRLVENTPVYWGLGSYESGKIMIYEEGLA